MPVGCTRATTPAIVLLWGMVIMGGMHILSSIRSGGVVSVTPLLTSSPPPWPGLGGGPAGSPPYYNSSGVGELLLVHEVEPLICNQEFIYPAGFGLTSIIVILI